MITRFDHAVIGVRGLQEASDQFRALGFAVYPGGRHTGLGTENSIVRFGLDYLELLGIYSRDEVLAAGSNRTTLLDYLERQDGGLLGYALATNDIDALAQRFQQTGLDALGPYAMERLRPDGQVLRWRLLLPGGTAWRRPWPFFIQWEMPDEQRLRFEQPGEHRLGRLNVCAVTVLVEDIEAAKHLYGHQLGLSMTGEGAQSAGGSGWARFAAGALSIELATPNAQGPLAEALAANGEGLYEVVLCSANLDDSRRVLAERGVQIEPAGENRWLIPPQRAVGARLALVSEAA
jgi:hypothetical protein